MRQSMLILCALISWSVTASAKQDPPAIQTFREADLKACEALLADAPMVQQEVTRVIDHMGTKVLGMRHVVERSVITVLLGGHVLLEGAPGL